MKCETKNQAQRVAYFGSLKMQKEGGYTLTQGTVDNWFDVTKEDGTQYGVLLLEKRGVCDCPFWQENAEFGACKHIYWVREELAREADFLSLLETAPDNKTAPDTGWLHCGG